MDKSIKWYYIIEFNEFKRFFHNRGSLKTTQTNVYGPFTTFEEAKDHAVVAFSSDKDEQNKINRIDFMDAVLNTF